MLEVLSSCVHIHTRTGPCCASLIISTPFRSFKKGKLPDDHTTLFQKIIFFLTRFLESQNSELLGTCVYEEKLKELQRQKYISTYINAHQSISNPSQGVSNRMQKRKIFRYNRDGNRLRQAGRRRVTSFPSVLHLEFPSLPLECSFPFIFSSHLLLFWAFVLFFLFFFLILWR